MVVNGDHIMTAPQELWQLSQVQMVGQRHSDTGMTLTLENRGTKALQFGSDGGGFESHRRPKFDTSNEDKSHFTDHSVYLSYKVH